MKKGALVKLIDVNGEERGHGLSWTRLFLLREGLLCTT